MGQGGSDGIRVIDVHATRGHQRGKRWLFRVWDPIARKWSSEAYADGDKEKGWSWAERQRARFTLGEARAGTSSFATLAADYVASLTDAGRDARYVADVKRLLDHLSLNGLVDVMAADVAVRVRTLIANLKPFAKGRLKPVGGTTRNRWLRQVRGCVQHGLTTGLLRHDPLAPLRRFHFKTERRLTESLSVDDLRLLVNADRSDSEWLPTVLKIYTGARARESVHFRWEWIDWKTGYIHVRLRPDFATKRNKERLIPLQPELARILRTLDHRALHGWIVPDAKSRNRAGWEHYEAFKSFLVRVGIDRPQLHPHSTRHTYAALMLATQVSPTKLRRVLGHTALSTTDAYAEAEMSLARAVLGWKPGEFKLLGRAPRAPARRRAKVS